MNKTKTAGRARITAALVAAGLIGGLGATAANATFNDVPEASPFAEHITSVQEAGIATGYADGSFRPTNALTRQQAAAWINRAVSRSSLDFSEESGEHTPVTPNDPTRAVATIEMSSPAANGGGGWVVLDGTVAAASADPGGAGCPCAFNVEVVDSDGTTVAIGALTAPGPEADDERTWVGPVGMAPVQGAVWLPGGTDESYTLEVTLVDADVESVLVAGVLSGQYTPMAEGDPDSFGAANGPVTLVPAP
ncbi:MAG TPA: S-layer homology domain-containing protein [Acidimicrobiales bacterium]|nr:S-layer homology domain-containing protein [Acidimicrobiales bacterium]